MAELTIREIEPAIVAKLEEQAEKHRRSVEDEHKAILRLALLGDYGQQPQVTFEEYLRMMPDVGTDDDFSRIPGSIRDVDRSGNGGRFAAERCVS